jgi:4-diphosphocytidyl-2-C-methyl-D-erythritol kinase
MAGWFEAKAQRHFLVEPSRLYNILYDFQGWSRGASPRLISKIDNESLIYSFPDGSRVNLSIIGRPGNLTRLEVLQDNLRDEDRAILAIDYWSVTLMEIASRLGEQRLGIASAPGKLNLFLKVGPKHESGYHDIATVFMAISLRERVIVEGDLDWSVNVAGALPPEQLAAVPTNSSNLAIKAAKQAAEIAEKDVKYPLKVSIDKAVPVAGGMGGGSADAAAAMLAANKVWGLGIYSGDLMKASEVLGADVPFAFHGGVAIGRGRGGTLETVESTPQYHFVLVMSPYGLSTPEVYTMLDALRDTRGYDQASYADPDVPRSFLKALRSGDPEKLAPELHNDLTESSLAMRPELIQVLQAGIAAGGLASFISGSGPTIAVLCRDVHNADAVAQTLTNQGFTAFTATGPEPGARLED